MHVSCGNASAVSCVLIIEVRLIKTRRDHELVAGSELISGTEPNCGIIQ